MSRRCWNLLLGMAGASVGGMLFNGLGVDLGLGDLSISFEDLLAAFVGPVAVLLVVWFVKVGSVPASSRCPVS